jgi:4-amino-4-deoxy-L-arabinose transferase-like glycosyltransferase
MFLNNGNNQRRFDGLTWMILSFVVLNLLKMLYFIGIGIPPLSHDAKAYWEMGQRIVDGDLLLLMAPPVVSRTPGYPYFLAFFQWIFSKHAYVAAMIAQQFLVFGTTLIISWTCYRLTKSRLGGLGGLVIGLFCFSQNNLGLYMLSDSLLCFTIASFTALLCFWMEKPLLIGAIGLGLALGICILVKPVMQLAWIPVIILMLSNTKLTKSTKQSYYHAFIMLLCMVLVVGPWYCRNRVNFGQYFLAKLTGRGVWWSCFYDSPNKTLEAPLAFAEDGPMTKRVMGELKGHKINIHDHIQVCNALQALGHPEVEAEDIMFSVAKEAIYRQPSQFLTIRLKRLVWYWMTPNGTFKPNVVDFRPFTESGKEIPQQESNEAYYAGQSHYYHPEMYDWWPITFMWRPHVVVYGIASLFTFLSLIILLSNKSSRRIGLLLGIVLFYLCLVVVGVARPEYRYRMINEPIMTMIVITALVLYYPRSLSCLIPQSANPKNVVQ